MQGKSQTATIQNLSDFKLRVMYSLKILNKAKRWKVYRELKLEGK